MWSVNFNLKLATQLILERVWKDLHMASTTLLAAGGIDWIHHFAIMGWSLPEQIVAAMFIIQHKSKTWKPVCVPSAFWHTWTSGNAIESLTDPISGRPSRGKRVSGIICLHVDDMFLCRWQRILPRCCCFHSKGISSWIRRHQWCSIRRPRSLLENCKPKVLHSGLIKKGP